MHARNSSGSSGFFASLFGGGSGGGSGGGGGSNDRFSLAELAHLHELLESKYAVVTPGNAAAVVETLRAVAELMIWGDQHDTSFFDFFVENQMMDSFRKLADQEAARRGGVAVQLLQTLSIMILNIRSETLLYYIFSNNHINRIIELRYDFRDEELLAHYISFLKTVSSKLNERTVQFFFCSSSSEREVSTFPLYAQAVSLFDNSESMVRAAVRTLTLNIFSIDDADVQAYLQEAVLSYAEGLSRCALNHYETLIGAVDTIWSTGRSRGSQMDACIAEFGDILYYYNDLLGLEQCTVGGAVFQSLWKELIRPHILGVITRGYSKEEERSSLLVALYSGARMMDTINNPAVVSAFAAALLLPHRLASTFTSTFDGAVPESEEHTKGGEKDEDDLYILDGESCGLDDLISLAGSSDPQIVAASLNLLVELIRCPHISEAVLDLADILPRRRQQKRQLLEGLSNGVSGEDQLRDALDVDGQQVAGNGVIKSDKLRKNSRNILVVQLIEVYDADRLTPRLALLHAAWLLLQLLVIPRRSLSWDSAPVTAAALQAPLESNPDRLDRVNSSMRDIEFGVGKARLKNEWDGMLRTHGAAARASLMQEAEDLWSDGLIKLTNDEWNVVRRSLEAPPQCREDGCDIFFPPPPSGLKSSQSAARSPGVKRIVERVVVLYQLRKSLAGRVPPPSAPLGKDANENLVLNLSHGDVVQGFTNSVAFPCKVAFERGREKDVVLSVRGAAAHLPFTSLVLLEMQKGHDSAIVRAIAPLMGADAHADEGHPEWVHFRVRAPFSVFKTRDGKIDGRTLTDGRWTLCFENAAASRAAIEMLEVFAGELRGFVGNALAPLMRET